MGCRTYGTYVYYKYEKLGSQDLFLFSSISHSHQSLAEGTTRMTSSTNVTWHDTSVTQSDRWSLSGHKGAIVWFTGLSGSGKSSVANAVESVLNREFKMRTYLLDGDNIR